MECCIVSLAWFALLSIGRWTCKSLVKLQGKAVCTDARMPNYVLTLKCPATCAKANGAMSNVTSQISDHECIQSCLRKPSTCQEWLNMTYRVGGCATKCTPDFKLFYRPSLDCKHTVAAGDLVSLATTCLLYTSPSPRDYAASRMPSSA